MSGLEQIEPIVRADARIWQLMEGNGFNVPLGPDDFGYAFTGWNLERRSISAKWASERLLALALPTDVQQEVMIDRAAGRRMFDTAPDGSILVRDAQGQAGALILRVAALLKALPTNPLVEFQRQASGMPETTEAERLVRQRVGQPIFRDALDTVWNGRCAVTGLSDRALLRASHIKRWADCATDAERLDSYNGLLLAAHIDAAFDVALISFDDEGAMLFSPKLTPEAKRLIDPGPAFRLTLSPQHQIYLDHHRARHTSLPNGILRNAT